MAIPSKITKAYKKKLKSYSDFIPTADSMIEYMLMHMRRMRDTYLLSDEEDQKINLIVNSLNMIITEYDAYDRCIDKYFKQNPDGTVEQLIEGDRQDALKKLADEQTAHWNRFWALLAAYARIWDGLEGAE